MNTFQFTLPTAINGDQLKNELNAEDVYVVGDALFVVGNFTKSDAESIINAHKPIAPKQPTLQEKLASVGLSIDDLKQALGLEQPL